MSKKENFFKEIKEFEKKYNSKVKNIKTNSRTGKILNQGGIDFDFEIDDSYIDNIIIIDLEKTGVTKKIVEPLL